MENRNYNSVGSKLLRGIDLMSKWTYRNKFVSFILCVSGAVIISSLVSREHTPTAPERVAWRRKKIAEQAIHSQE